MKAIEFHPISADEVDVHLGGILVGAIDRKADGLLHVIDLRAQPGTTVRVGGGYAMMSSAERTAREHWQGKR